jgi:hypothetical protein
MYGLIRGLAAVASLAILTGLPPASHAQELEKPLDARISFSERHFDFGFLPKGVHALHTYKIENKGKDTLRIIKVSPTCGCTSSPLDKSNIEPGGSSRLEMFFNSAKYTGRVAKKISILSNDPSDPYTDISFSSIVDKEHPFVKASPALIKGDKESRGRTGVTHMVELTSTAPDPLKLKIVSSSEPYLEAKLSADEVKPGESVNLMIKVKGFCESVPDPWYSVTLESSDPQRYRLTIPVYAPK